MILEKYKRYNANSKGVNTGDCVCRAISLAFNVPYDSVHTELLRAKGNQFSYKISEVYSKVIKKYNPNAEHVILSSPLTEEEFCEKYPVGTYICKTQGENYNDRHLVTIIDGDIYDTWNSSGWKVVEYYVVKSDAEQSLTHDDINLNQWLMNTNFLHEYVAPKITTLIKSVAPDLIEKGYEFTINYGASPNDLTTVIFRVNMKPPRQSRRTFDYPLTLSPKVTNVEQGVIDLFDVVFKKLKTKLYSINAKVSGKSQHNPNVDIIPEHPDYTYHTKSLTPDQRRLIKWLEGGNGYYRVTFYMLPDDPEFGYSYLKKEFPLTREEEIFDGVTGLKKALNTYIKSNGAQFID